MTGRYARARAAQGLLFDNDVSGDVRKDTTLKTWVEAPPLVAQLLKVDEGSRVYQRNTRTYVDDTVTEETALYFPEPVIRAVPRLETEDRIFIVPFIESAGYVITRTANELRARHANAAEQEIFGLDATGIVIEHAHGTYGADGAALEAVINVRPAAGQVITFDTYEAPN